MKRLPFRYLNWPAVLVCLFFTNNILGQALPPLQPEQDCINAIPVCQNIYIQPNSYQGEGANPNEINSGISCLGSGELNDVWYIFTVQTAGDVCFSIIPNVPSEDYDWAVYDLTSASCSDIATNPNIEVSCNYAGANVTCAGVTGPNNTTTGPCAALNEPCIPVQVGETYVINVSNFSSTANGYTLDFTASTATIGDNTPPALDSVAFDCDGDISVFFTENVICNTVEPADFLVTNGTGGIFPVFAVAGGACAAGGTFENEYVLSFANNPLPNDTYYIELVGNVTDNCSNIGTGGLDSLDLNVEALTITATADTICEGDSVFLDAAGIAGATYAWNFGGFTDSVIGVAPLTTITYAVTSITANCVYNESFEVFVRPKPQSAFTAPVQVCPDSPAVITFTGTAPAGSTYDWDFDGGTILSGTGEGPYSIEWLTGGARTVSLAVTSPEGCTSDTVTNLVNVPPVPTAVLDVPAQTCLEQLTQYGISSGVSPTATYTWSQDGQTIISGAGAGPYEVFWDTPGPKDICLIVEESGCPSLPICTQIIVNDLPNIAVNAVDNQCLEGNLFNFTSGSTSNLTDYLWDLDDNGITSPISSTPYVYPSAGIRTVVLTVTDANGCVNSDSITFEVYPEVNAAFAFDTVCEGSQTTFLDQTVAGSGIANWSWTFGDGGFNVVQNPTYAYTSDSIYQVELVVTTVDGCADSITQSVEVYDTPEAAFTFDLTCEAQVTQLFNASTFDNPEVSYSYTFPNGQTSEVEDPFYTFASSGPQPVSLTVVNSDGCSDVFTQPVDVFSVPEASFSAPEVCDGELMPLQNTSIIDVGDSIVNLNWTLSDGSTYEGDRPLVEHLFDEPNRYYVELLVTSLAGCKDSTADSVYVWGNPFVEFEADPACARTNIPFDNRSGTAFFFGGTLTSYEWDFGDGSTGGGRNPGHVYAQGGDYEITLTVTTDKGCTATDSRRLEVYNVPDAPNPVGDTACIGDAATLSAALSLNADQIAWYENQSDPAIFTGTSYETDPLSSNQTYYAAAFSDEGCESERIPVRARLYPAMEGAILKSDSIVEMPEAIIAFEVIGNFAGESYLWDFGERSRSEEAAPIHQYQEAGEHIVNVMVTSDVGCELSLSTLVQVLRISTAFVPNAFSPNDDGYNDEFYIGSYNLDQIEFAVYNQWGQVVFLTDEKDFRWDGRSNQGRPVPTGTYVFRLSGVDVHGSEVTRQGTITLVR